jgi:hypothetical protein
LAFDVFHNAEKRLIADLFSAGIEPEDFDPAELPTMLENATSEFSMRALYAVKMSYDRLVVSKEELNKLGGHRWL